LLKENKKIYLVNHIKYIRTSRAHIASQEIQYMRAKEFVKLIMVRRIISTNLFQAFGRIKKELEEISNKENMSEDFTESDIS